MKSRPPAPPPPGPPTTTPPSGPAPITTSPPAPETPQTTLGVRLAYGFGAVAYGVKDNGFAYLLLFYYDQVLGLSAGWAGFALMTAMLFDAVSDPLVGYISDNWRSRWGRRHPFMYAALLPVAASYLLLWNPPQGLSQGALFTWLLVIAVLVRTLITLYEIPSTALVSEFTDRYDERTTLLSFRYFFAWWGGLIMSIVAYWVFFATDAAGGQGQLEASGYLGYSLFASLLIGLGILVSTVGTHHRIPTLRAPPPPVRKTPLHVLRELRESLANHSIRVLFLGALAYAGAAGVSAALSIYLATYLWGLSSAQIGWLNVGYLGSAMAALTLAPACGRRFGKKPAAIFMALAAIVPICVMILLRINGFLPPPGSHELFLMLFVVNTVDIALLISSNILIASMVADVVEESELETGRRSEGVFFAARSFAAKAVSGFGIVGATLMLAIVDFPEDARGVGDVSEEVLARFGILYIITLGFFYLTAVFFYSRYRITREAHERNLHKLSRGAQQRAPQ